ncbi:MAG TPA: glycosyl hydrolase family 28 protein [Polyangiaceae bacterium]
MRALHFVWPALCCALGCSSDKIASLQYQCGSAPDATVAPDAVPGVCGANDPNLPLEPTLPTDVCQTVVADKSSPDENDLDSNRIQAALAACSGRAVKLVSDGAHNAFVAAHLTVDSSTLWIDRGVTLYASRNADLYQKTGSCGVLGVNDSGACNDFITVRGTNPAIVGDGVIDGQGGEPLVGHDYSWWQMSGALQEIDGSIGNPTLINLSTGTTGFVLYRITLHNSPKFHVKITSSPADGSCDAPGQGFIVWGVTVLTPSNWLNSQGLPMSPHFARNTDGIDPGTSDIATCGVIACSTISTGDDQIAIKGGHWVSDLVIAHNHFGTGHGMSIGSETYGTYQDMNGVLHHGVENVSVYDLTVDGDTRPVGDGASPADSNGIRVKSDSSRGGLVNNITFSDVCLRDVANAIMITPAYNPLFAGTSYPQFKNLTFQNIHDVTCMSPVQPVVTLEGFNASLPAGPITLDNVVVDNIGPQAVAAAFADIRLGPGNVNFMPNGLGVTVTNGITGASAPRACQFPTLPVPPVPAGWLR